MVLNKHGLLKRWVNIKYLFFEPRPDSDVRWFSDKTFDFPILRQQIYRNVFFATIIIIAQTVIFHLHCKEINLISTEKCMTFNIIVIRTKIVDLYWKIWQKAQFLLNLKYIIAGFLTKILWYYIQFHSKKSYTHDNIF